MSYLEEVCKVGQGAATCRYIGQGMEGYRCLKVMPDMKAKVDARAEHMHAKGDNCDGREGDLLYGSTERRVG